MIPRQIVAWAAQALGSIACVLTAGRGFFASDPLGGTLELEDGPIPRKLSR